MSTEFALDLKLARRKAGLTQRDLAHLLGAHQGLVSELEHGRRGPTLPEIVTLSLIYGRSFESLFAEIMRDARRDIRDRLRTLPGDVRSYVGTFNRAGFLKRLEHRLVAEDPDHGGA